MEHAAHATCNMQHTRRQARMKQPGGASVRPIEFTPAQIARLVQLRTSAAKPLSTPHWHSKSKVVLGGSQVPLIAQGHSAVRNS